MNLKRGISITILVITMIIMIIIAGAVIANLRKDNSINKAHKAAFKQDIKEFSKELQLELDGRIMEDDMFDPYKVNADTYSDIKKYIKKFTKEYEGLVVIKNGELVYIGSDSEEKEWMNEIGIKVE